MEELNYKQEITSSRVGSLGGSDGNLLQQVCSLGYVPKSAYKRIAVMNGLVENPNVSTRIMRFGDFTEQETFKNLIETNPNFQSNPLWVSGKYSKDGCRLIAHPDFVLFDEENKILKVYEMKSTKFDFRQTRSTYMNQLFIEWTLANEIVKIKGEGWKVQMYLVLYDTNGVDFDEPFVFEPERLSIHKLRMADNVFDIDRAMTLVSEFASTFDYYTEEEEIDSRYLPEKVKQEFDTITAVLAEIKQRETKVDEFKRKLYDFMLDKNIKGIRSEEWSITRVDASESKSFDGKKYLSDLKALHPRKAKKIEEKYAKTVSRGGYVKILVRKDNKS